MTKWINNKYIYSAIGLLLLLALWHLLVVYIVWKTGSDFLNDLKPSSSINALIHALGDDTYLEQIYASLIRVLKAISYSVLIGIPIGIIFGRFELFSNVFYLPFQLLRMISPLSWMPIAVIIFATWDEAIVFLLTIASVWPVIFATAQGVSKIDPNWMLLAKSLRMNAIKKVLYIVFPAIAVDILTGIRLAIGVCWIIIVPAEYLGVSSGLGYAINDARDTFSYDLLGALIVTIGFIGLIMDFLVAQLKKQFKWHI